MYNILLHLHSVSRWAILIFLVLALVKAFSGWFGKKPFTESDKKPALYTFIFSHIQLLLGFGLYFISPFVSFEEGAIKNEVYRFYTMEHFSMMLIAIIIISVGYILSKKAKVEVTKFKRIAVFYLIGLIIILAAIPWPFRFANAGWF